MGNLVTISTYDTTVAADLDRIYLEDSGLNVFLADYHMVGLDWLRANALGGIKLQVAEDDVATALSRLQELPRNRFDNTAIASTEEKCLSCGTLMPLDEETCSHCGWSYIE